MKKFSIVFLSLFLVVSLPFAAHANIVTATGKYLINAVKHVPGGAKVNAKNTVTGAEHVIKHGVSSAELGKGIGAGIVGGLVGGGVGLAFQAITGVALDAVDWVMDPANNQIKWKKKGDAGGEFNSSNSFCFSGQYCAPTGLDSAQKHADSFIKLGYQSANVVETRGPNYSDRYGWEFFYAITGLDKDGKPYRSGVHSNSAPSGYQDNQPVPLDKSVPLDVLAAKIISQADGGNVDSQKTIEEYVTNLAKEGKLDAELDASTDIIKPDEPTKPDDKDKDCPIGTTKEGEVCVKPAPDNVPLFCNQSDFTRKICDWIDWTQEKPDDLKPDAGNVDVIDKSKDLTINENRIDFSNQCPPPTPINLTVMGFGYTEELSYQPMCDFFAMLNPFIVGMGGISSALIIAGGVRRG